MSQNLSSAAVVTGALRVNVMVLWDLSFRICRMKFFYMNLSVQKRPLNNKCSTTGYEYHGQYVIIYYIYSKEFDAQSFVH